LSLTRFRRPGRTLKIAATSFFLFLAATGPTPAAELDEKLIDAAFSGKVEAARSLIDQGADVNAVDAVGNPALLTATRPYNTEMVQLLVDSGAEANTAGALGDTPLLVAARTGLTDIVRILLEADADPNYTRSSDGGTALMEACIFGRNDIVTLLVEAGADVNAEDRFGFTPLAVAQKNEHANIADYLIQHGAEN